MAETKKRWVAILLDEEEAENLISDSPMTIRYGQGTIERVSLYDERLAPDDWEPTRELGWE